MCTFPRLRAASGEAVAVVAALPLTAQRVAEPLPQEVAAVAEPVDPVVAVPETPAIRTPRAIPESMSWCRLANRPKTLRWDRPKALCFTGRRLKRRRSSLS